MTTFLYILATVLMCMAIVAIYLSAVLTEKKTSGGPIFGIVGIGLVIVSGIADRSVGKEQGKQELIQATCKRMLASDQFPALQQTFPKLKVVEKQFTEPGKHSIILEESGFKINVDVSPEIFSKIQLTSSTQTHRPISTQPATKPIESN